MRSIRRIGAPNPRPTFLVVDLAAGLAHLPVYGAGRSEDDAVRDAAGRIRAAGFTEEQLAAATRAGRIALTVVEMIAPGPDPDAPFSLPVLDGDPAADAMPPEAVETP